MSCNLNYDIQNTLSWLPSQYKSNFIKDYFSPLGTGITTQQVSDILISKSFISTTENQYNLENNFTKVSGIESINLLGTDISKVTEAYQKWNRMWTILTTPNSRVVFLTLDYNTPPPFCRNNDEINPYDIHDPRTAFMKKITSNLVNNEDMVVITDRFFSSIMFCYKVPDWHWHSDNAFFWIGLQGDGRVWDDRFPYDQTTRFNTLRFNDKCMPEFHFGAVLSGYVEWGTNYTYGNGQYDFFLNSTVDNTDINSWDTDNLNTSKTIIVQFKYDTMNRNTFFSDFFKTQHPATIKWKALCCYTIPRLTNQDSSFPVITFSNYTDFREISGVPTTTCDNFMFKTYCVNNSNNPVCGCSENTLTEDQKKLRQLLINQGLVSDIKCLSSKCNNNIAYQNFNIKNTVCANKCVGIINEEIGSFGKLNVDGMTMTLSCDSNGNILTQSKCIPECKNDESCINNVCNGCISNSDCLNGKSCLAGYCVGAENPIDIESTQSVFNVYILIGIVIFSIIVSIILGYFLSKIK